MKRVSIAAPRCRVPFCGMPKTKRERECVFGVAGTLLFSASFSFPRLACAVLATAQVGKKLVTADPPTLRMLQLGICGDASSFHCVPFVVGQFPILIFHANC